MKLKLNKTYNQIKKAMLTQPVYVVLSNVDENESYFTGFVFHCEFNQNVNPSIYNVEILIGSQIVAFAANDPDDFLIYDNSNNE